MSALRSRGCLVVWDAKAAFAIVFQKVSPKVAWHWNCFETLSKNLIWSRSGPSPTPPKAFTNCKMWLMYAMHGGQPAAIYSTTAVSKYGLASPP